MNQPIEQSRWLPSQQTVRQLLAPALVFVVACLDRQFQTDFWMHLARGGEIVATGAVITADHYAIAAVGQAVRDPNWLSQVIYCRLFSWGGLPLVQVTNALTLSASLWLLVRLCRSIGASWRSAAAAGVIAFLVAWQTFLIRPQSFSVLLFVLLYAALSRAVGRSLLLWPPLILMLWVNLHGAFLIGLALIAIFGLAAAIDELFPGFPSLGPPFRGGNTPAERGAPNGGDGGTRGDGRLTNAKWLLGSLALSCLATLLNPYGWRIYQSAFSLAATVIPRHVEEWLAPPMNQWIGQSLVGSALLIGGLYLARRRRPTVREALLLICFLPLALHSARMVIWWAIITAPIVASLLDTLAQHQDEKRTPSNFGRAMSTILCAILLSLCVISLPWLEKINPIFTYVRSSHRAESDLDDVARSWLDASKQSRGVIFARLEWGQYLDWRLGPRERLLVDGHVELASEQAWRDYCAVNSGDPRWEQILDRYSVDYLLLDDDYQSTLLSCVRRSNVWEEAFRSGDALLFTRRRAGTLSRSAYLIRTTHPIVPRYRSVEPMDARGCVVLLELLVQSGGSHRCP